MEEVIDIDGAGIVVAIFRGLVARMARRARNLILGQIHGIAALVGVIGQHLPGYGIMVAADTEEATEFEHRSEEHTSELQSLMRTSYAVFCLKKKNKKAKQDKPITEY